MPSGPCPAEIMIVGEAPGAEEERLGQPFVGASGQELDRLLHESGFLRSECMVTNVCRVRPPKNDISNFVVRTKKKPGAGNWEQAGGYWCKPQVIEGLQLLEREIELCQPKVIIALGNLSLWALTGKWGITDWRGSSLRYSRKTEIIVLPTYHPAAILRMWQWRHYITLDLQRVRSLLTDGIIEPDYRFITRPHFSQAYTCLKELLAKVQAGPTHISCDLETRWGQTACIGLAWSELDAICIPLMKSGSPQGYWAEHEEFFLIRILKEILEHENCLVSGQNFIYDAQYLWRGPKILPNLALDTMVTHHVLWPGTDKGLDVLSSLYCKHHVFWKNDGKDWPIKQDENILWRYNCEDAVRTWEVANVLVTLVKTQGLTEQCLFQHRMWWRAFETMVDGVRMDLEAKAALGRELAAEEKSRYDWLESIIGHRLNPKSPKQMKAFFYDDLKLPVQYKRDKYGTRPTLEDAALRVLCKKEPIIQPIVRRILEIRSLGVYRATFVEADLDNDQRMRCSYNIAGTGTFRLKLLRECLRLGNEPPKRTRGESRRR